MQGMTWTPPDLLKLSGSYWEACALHAAVKLDLFTNLCEAPLSAAVLAKRLNLNERGLAMLLDAITALGLLKKENESYRSTPFSAQFLSTDSKSYLGHIIKHRHHLVDSWTRLDETVRTGQPSRSRVSHESDEVERESFLLGMFDLAMLMAPRVVSQIDLTGRRKLIDLGGGPGTYAIHFCQQNPGLQATIFDLPTTSAIADKTVRRFELQDRIGFAAGDFQNDSLPGSFDVAWLSHVLHGEGESGCANMLRKAVSALEPGGLLLVHDFILNDARDGPLFPALFSLNMLLGTPHGRAYSEAELKSLLESAGLIEVERLPLALPNGAGIVCGIKPD